jgi:hypothetical protein
MDTSQWVGVAIVGGLLLVLLYFLPTYIAFNRNHEYKWIIFAINAVMGASGLGWLIAFVWAVWPQDKSIADPVLGNPTGTGRRNAGHTMGEVRASAAQSRGRPAPGANSVSALEALDKLAELAAKGIISHEEFAQKKADLLSQV